jgi:hypothetical protein
VGKKQHPNREWVLENYPEATFLFADGFDDCIVGVDLDSFGTDEPRIVYDRAACIASLAKQGMTEEEAEEYFTFNVTGAYVGDQTPLFICVKPR